MEASEEISKHSVHAYRLREGIFILCAAVALFLLMALVTYHRADPHLGAPILSSTVANAGGRVGAYFADLFFFGFGYAAYLFPGMIGFAAWLGYRQLSVLGHTNAVGWMLRFTGFTLLLLGSTSLMALCFSETTLPFSAGGMLGKSVGHAFVASVNLTGATVLLLAFFFAGVTLSTGLSWWTVLDFVGRNITQFLNYLVGLYHFFVLYFEERRNTKTERAALKRMPPVVVKKPKRVTRIETPAPATPPSTRALQEKQVPLFDELATAGNLPSLALLDPPEPSHEANVSNEVLEARARDVEARLMDFGIEVQVVAVHPGPVITRFELQLAPGIKVSKISTLAKDLARSLSVTSVRVVEVIPGKSVVGLEIPNEHRAVVRLSEVLSSQPYDQARSPVSIALGKDIAGHPVIVDLAKMPHLLVAGTTGSGKSVGLNAMLLSMLYKSTPQEVRMILIDPKMLELSIYEGIPHLLVPVVTDMKEAANALRWCVVEMDRRYRLMASLGVRNLMGYNGKVLEARKKGTPLLDPFWNASQSEQPEELTTLSYIVVIIDEFADMMMVVGKKVEEMIARIAQKARAAGIHMILATQRPSVDVITGLIKANISTRIAFQVSSKIDSRTILDQSGAEQLLGHGDMLYLAPGTGIPTRVHGAFVADHEVHTVVKAWKMRGSPEYVHDILKTDETDPENKDEDASAEQDPLYDQAVQIVLSTRRASISQIQRRLKIGYNRAARMVEEMEVAGVVGPMEHNGSREVLVPERGE